MTKLLRILTGVHAGAELRLAVGTHRIGADDDADIHISDWCGNYVSLAVHEHAPGMVHVAVIGSDSSGAHEASKAAQKNQPGTVILLDFVPMQFGCTVICIGPAAAPWPSDLELLSTLLVRPDETRCASERSRRGMEGVVFACAMLSAVLVIGSGMLTSAVSRDALQHDAGDIAQRVNLTLAAAHMKELHAQARGSTVTVTGMVGTPAEDSQVRKLLMRVSSSGIVRHYDISQNDVRNIAESLGTQGLKVVYAGHGEFEVSGAAANPRDVESAVARMRHDLSDNVKNVRVRVAQAEDSQSSMPSFSFLMSSDDVRYALTPDGVKHIYARPEVPVASALNDASALSGSNVDNTANELARAPIVRQPVEDIPATPPSPATREAKTTAYLPLPK
ncbi:hypothetical protein [Cupriavidus sp. UYPR2.512]|uniref:hypothetical protein n=1 Tax=Cupriavidus sp. UYPR2.512 TaxID=1080187 RepID=UPI00036656F0|nr:hypothetical protein [Cupriavidus sp. UYPR2.512]UIF88520.1 secretion protein [Cupriavidus necator]